jgi:hypothetical protein
MELKRLFIEFLKTLSGVRRPHPDDRVRFNLEVAEEAQYLANRLKSGVPEFNVAVLAATARILDIEPAVTGGLRKVA